MAKPELGTKRQCRSCGNRFYDLERDPIVCPKCGAVFEVAALKGAPAAVAEVSKDAEVPAAAATDPELVSLEEAEADAGGKTADTEEDAAEGDASGEDETFLEEEEEGDDVSTLIDGDIEDDEEA